MKLAVAAGPTLAEASGHDWKRVEGRRDREYVPVSRVCSQEGKIKQIIASYSTSRSRRLLIGIVRHLRNGRRARESGATRQAVVGEVCKSQRGDALSPAPRSSRCRLECIESRSVRVSGKRCSSRATRSVCVVATLSWFQCDETAIGWVTSSDARSR